MKPVWKRIGLSELEGNERDLAVGMVQMFCDLGPFQTFGTVTVAPRHDRCGVSAQTMERLVLRLFKKRRFKGMKFGYFIEKNKQRFGTHGHFVTVNEPEKLRWSGKNSVGEMMIEKYGRFQTNKVNGECTFGLAAYLAKYCSKEHADGHWGFVNFDKPDFELDVQSVKPRPMWDRDPAPSLGPDVIAAWKENQKAWKWKKDSGRKIRMHSGSRENGRLNIKTHEVREAGERFGHFEQVEVYNNLK
jgi:hypothetical protein